MFSSYFYYVTVGISITCYLGCLRHFRLPLVTFSTVNYFSAVILAILPGYAASVGRYLPSSLDRGFDHTIYLIYVSYAITLTGASLLGQIMAKRYALVGKARSKLNLRVGLVLLFVLIYACAYFYWVPYIPLKNLISGAAELASAAEQRISITHQLGKMGSGLPWPFRYWRTVLQFWPVILCFYMAYSRQLGMRISRTVYVLCLIGTAFLVMFTLEKILIVQFVFGLLVLHGVALRKVRLGRLALIATICVVLSMGTIAVFMGGEVQDLLGALLARINEQTSSTYVQIEYVREHGFLGLRGISFPFEGWVFGKEYFVDLGRESYAIIFPEKAATGFVGSAAGLSLADLYFALGWMGLPIFGLMIAVHSWVDIAWRNGVLRPAVDLQFRRVSGAFYVFGMSFFSLTFVSSVFLIVSPPFGLSAECILIGILFVFLIRVTSLKVMRSK